MSKTIIIHNTPIYLIGPNTWDSQPSTGVIKVAGWIFCRSFTTTSSTTLTIDGCAIRSTAKWWIRCGIRVVMDFFKPTQIWDYAIQIDPKTRFKTYVRLAQKPHK